MQEWNSSHRLVAQMHRQRVPVGITTLLWLVSAYACLPPSQLTSPTQRVFYLFSVSLAWTLSQMLNLFISCIWSAHWRLLHFHGQKHARLMSGKTAYDKPPRERSILVSLLSPLLFMAPEVHLREMEKLLTDDLVIESVWNTFMSKLVSEWNGLILWVRSHVSLGLEYLSLT